MSMNRFIGQDHDYCLHNVCGGMHNIKSVEIWWNDV
jgi:hypothetical protein